MTSKPQDIDVPSTVKSLRKSIDDENYSDAFEFCNKLLSVQPDDKEYLNVKILCLLELGNFNGVKEMFHLHKNLVSKFPYEFCYTLLVDEKYEEALKFFSQNEKGILSENEEGEFLLSQIHFYLGNYKIASEIYGKLLFADEDEEFDSQTFTNYVASLILSNQSNKSVSQNLLAKMRELPEEEMYELFYNVACSYIELRNFGEGSKYLDMAEQVCRGALERRKKSDAEISRILTPVTIQRGFIQQLLGNNTEAEETYSKIIKEKPKGQAVALAVAGNNLVSIYKGNQSVYEAERRMKFALQDSLKGKLTKWQQRGVDLNRVLLLLRMKNFSECRALFTEIRNSFPDTDIPTLVEASLAYRQKDFKKAIELLKEFIDGSQKSVRAEISLAQLYLNRGQVDPALEVIRKSYLRHRPSVVGCLVGLYKKLGKFEECEIVFGESVKYWSEMMEKETAPLKKKEFEDPLVVLLKEYAEYLFSVDKVQQAVSTYNKMLEIDPENKSFTAGLVIALAKRNINRTKELAESLPEVDWKKYSGKSLEKIPVYLVKEKKRKVMELHDDGENILLKKKGEAKKKRKRRNKKPKNFNPGIKPDPERWLPKWERSKYKKLKEKKHKRHQGALGGVEELELKKKEKKNIKKIIKGKGQKKPTKRKPQTKQKKKGKKKKKRK